MFFEDGTFEIIQVKYYPKASPKMKEISTDLYYQYLRLQMLQSTLIAAPRLYIHTNSEVKELTLDKMKKNIELENTLPESVIYPNAEDSVIWLKTNIYSINIKEEQKKRLFKKMASESSLKEFVTNFDVIPQQDIKQYKKDLMEALSKAYPSFDKEGSDEEHRQLILLGLAISYLQQRYVLDDPDFSQLRVDKKSFDSYMKTSTMTKTEQTIVNYLVGVACSVILPPVGGKFNSVKRKIVERMVKSSPKPGKWFFENTKLTKGKNYYNYSTANVNENPTVADLGEDSFYIECMDCIGIDETEWSIKENCSDCIFSEKCVKEEV